MIKSLHLQNFQSHASTNLQFSPGVNVIVGGSDCGKTAILRAINWLVTNRPSGDAFRRHGTEAVGTHIRLRLTTGEEVERGIDKKGGFYRTDGKELRAFRAEVPEAVATALNLDPVNVQSQHDAPFLLSESSGEVARQLNRVARLDVIDTALAAAQGRVRETTRSLKEEEARAKSQTEEVTTLAWVDVAEEMVSYLEQVDANRRNRLKRLGELQALGTEIIKAEVKVKELEAPLTAQPTIMKSLNLVTALKCHREGADLVQALIKEAAATQDVLDRTSKVVLAGEFVTKLERLNDARMKVSRKVSQGKQLLSDVKATECAARTQAQRAERLEEEFHKQMGSTCPLCGKKVK